MKPRELRHCTHHGNTLFVQEGSGKRWRCIECRSEAVHRRRRKVKEMAIDYKGGACERCGYDKCASALEFHHTDPAEKDFHLGSKGHTRSWERVKSELDKCILVCANCHREIHAGVRRVPV